MVCEFKGPPVGVLGPDVPVVHVCLVVPASEVRTMHSKQPCPWNVSRVPREQVGGSTMMAALLPQLKV